MKTIPFEPLDPSVYRQIVRRALAEDLGWGDVTTEATVPADVRGRGTIVVKSPCVLAGLDVAAEAFRQLDPAVHITLRNRDGDRCEAGAVAAEVRGAAALMLTAERTALNFLQRLSGIATLTRRYVDAADGRIIVLDTRKTTPTLRALEKYAVRAGGGSNHRSGLDDGILIKDNHVRLAGGVAEAVKRMKAARQEMLVEVEAQSLADVEAAIDAARRRHPARQPAARADPPGRGPHRRPRQDRNLWRRDARAHARARSHRSRLRVGRRLDPLGARRRSQLRDRSRHNRCLTPFPPDLADALRAVGARRGRLGDPLYYLHETTSTNDLAAAYAERGAPEGTTVVAAAQTSGRGRLGRSWYSPPGAGLYLSIDHPRCSRAHHS